MTPRTQRHQPLQPTNVAALASAARRAPRDARRRLALDGPFKLLHGALPSVELAYETWGELSPAQDNAVLIFTGLSPSAHVASSPLDPSAGWWEDMVGPAKPIDTDRYFVLCVNSLGSCFGSTGPASKNPRTGAPWRLDFPSLRLEDVANAGHAVARALGIERLHAVVGASMGGMTALAYAMLHPESVAALVSISSAARALPFAIAVRSLQREMIRSDPAWRNGQYDAAAPPTQGMQLARKLGMISYRSAAEWAERFGRERATGALAAQAPFGIDFEVESYLQAHADKFADAFDANCYLYLSRAMDLFDVCDHGGSLAAGFKRVQAERALVIGVTTDFLFPLSQQRELAQGLQASVPDVTYRELSSMQGHDSFLVDMDRFRPPVAAFFQGERP